MEVSLLAGLNEAQTAAVTSTAPVLQVLAPPGSGKTKTLTSRVAHLLANRNLNPHNVICCTFTIKASREMRERLESLVGKALESKLVLGTFHSVCRRYLATYGNRIGIPRSFSIADSSDSKSMIKKIIKKNGFKAKPSDAQSKISGCKARFRTVDVLRQEQAKAKHSNEEQQELIEIYAQYQTELQRNNLLDYDDLLLRCVDLLRDFPLCVANVEAVLVDEFQDTNIVQFELMKLFASARGNVTIVGDPDQSIYGFRSAEIANLKRMQAFYQDTVVINLAENYRSAAAVLNLAQDVIDQDKERPDKKLRSTHCYGTLPVLRKLSDSREEGLWIAHEVKRIMGTTGGLIGPSDIAVLLRSSSLSLQIERGLTNAGIAYRMVGGMRFFDRAEIRLIIDYMRTIAHPDNNAAFLSIINVPSRKIGEAAISSLVKLSESHDISIWRAVQKVVNGSLIPEKKLTGPAQNDLAKLVTLIKRAQDKMAGCQPATVPGQLISYLTDSLKIPAYLQQKYKEDHEDRIENIQEFITHAVEFATLPVNAENLPVVSGADQQDLDERQEALDRFLSNIVLSSEVQDSTDDKPRVTISTIHSAKGLEWPVVFIPAVYEGSIPHSRAGDEVDEERRLLYVAITRAKALLNMTLPMYSSREDTIVSLTQFLPQHLIHRTAEKAPTFTDNVISDVAAILQRDVPSQEAIAQGVASIGEKDSLEDDLWPLDGSRPLGPEQSVLLSNFPQQGMSLAEAEKLTRASGQQARSQGYQTSMSNANGFSTAQTSMNMGFTTAGQQLRNFTTKTETVATKQANNGLSGPRGTASSEGKETLKGFFTTQPRTSAAVAPAEAARQAWSSRPSTSAPVPARSLAEPHLPPPPGPPARSFSNLPSALTEHRLGGPSDYSFGRASAPGHKVLTGVGLKRPRPLPLNDASPNRHKKHYSFLSSSPTREDKDAAMLGDDVNLDGGNDDGTRIEQENNHAAKKLQAHTNNGASEAPPYKRPATLAGRPNPGAALPASASMYPKKRSLGVRGGCAPWSARKNK